MTDAGQSERANHQNPMRTLDFWKDVVVGLLGLVAILAVLTVIGWLASLTGVFPGISQNPSLLMYVVGGIGSLFVAGFAFMGAIVCSALLGAFGESIRERLGGVR